MPPQVKKAKTAFLYYQGDKLAAIRNELGVSMGDAMTEVSLLFPKLGTMLLVASASCQVRCFI